jgi:hypothetical protein
MKVICLTKDLYRKSKGNRYSKKLTKEEEEARNWFNIEMIVYSHQIKKSRESVVIFK